MSFDWDSMWNQVKEGADKLNEQFQQVGVPVIKASIEQWAINAITEQNKETQKQVEAGLSAFAAQPSSPLGQAVAQVTTQAAAKQYGLYIVFGVVAIGLIAIMAAKK